MQKIRVVQIAKINMILPPPIDKDLYYGTMLLVKHCYNDLTNETAEDFDIRRME